MCHLSKDKCIHTHVRALRSVLGVLLFFFLMCVQNIRILMDHKGVHVQALTWGFSAGKCFSVGFCCFWTCEICKLTYANTTSRFVDSDYPKICVRLVRLLLRQLELVSWEQTNDWLLPQGKVCLTIMCTWCLWCVWRKLTIIGQRLFLKL